ncbi:MAG: SGNH/GDSL hydrolase family protein [Bacteroidales bacterium]|jgi:hypothetical protein|nr:SGNH/GDSL hydrolase family protein [Bacteroidales bacterium]
MIRFIIYILLLTLLSSALNAQQLEDLKYVNADDLMLIGKGFENAHVKYGRLPASMEKEFRKELISLGKNTSGIAVRFSTNSTAIAARWTVIANVYMDHMPATGSKGLDLYVLDGNRWCHTGTARHTEKTSAYFFIKNLSGETREYIAYLPLYDGVELLEIGVDKEAIITKPQKSNLTKRSDVKPIVFYGTSITQGGCASRPGMAYPSILGRMLNREIINLGFSGNGKLDLSMARAISMIDAEAVVMDCLPNTTAQIVRDSAYLFIRHIADAHPGIRILMIENPEFPFAGFNTKILPELQEEDGEWKMLYEKLRKEGYKNIRYVRGKGMIGNDGEATVDGVHFTDLGFLRYAEGMYPYLKDKKVSY